MENSRRSFLGLGAALAGLFAVGNVKASPPPQVRPIAPLAPQFSFAVGDIKAFFEHQPRPYPGQSFVSSGNMEAVAIVKYKVWSGSEWVDLDTYTRQGY
jgi:hypothetical protein